MNQRWGLLTNHALVLIHVTEHPRSTLRDIASEVGITERAALSILRALEEDRIISRRKDGRRNVYSVDLDALMTHRSYGRYSIEDIATGLLTLSGRLNNDGSAPAGADVGADVTSAVRERMPAGARDEGR